MKKILLSLLLIASLQVPALAQPQQDAKQLYETAKTFIRQGDYDNALLVIKKALEKDPQNLDMLKELEFIYFLQRNYEKAMEVGKPLIERADADVQTFQMLGLTYRAIAEYKECRKLYRKALLKFPNSGVIYNDYGELLAMDKSLNEAIVQWEKGIETDANYSSNYYNAVKYYVQQNSPNLFWILIYGELFVNLESYTGRTVEMKKVLLEGYKKFYNTSDLTTNLKGSVSAFEKETINTLVKSSAIASDGINAGNIMAIKTRFVLDWFQGNEAKFPFRLFDHYQHMLKEGIFDAYNQWIYGSAANTEAYNLWVKTHDKEAEAFKKFQTARIFKIPAGQYYK
jgi:Tfp pilus assembly protein PilF